MLLWACSLALLILNSSLSHVGPAYTFSIFFLPFLSFSSTAPCLLSGPFQPRPNTAAPHPGLHITFQESIPRPAPASLPLPHPCSPVSSSALSTGTEDQRLFLRVAFMTDIVVTAKTFFTDFPDCCSQLPSENDKIRFQRREPAQRRDRRYSGPSYPAPRGLQSPQASFRRNPPPALKARRAKPPFPRRPNSSRAIPDRWPAPGRPEASQQLRDSPEGTGRAGRREADHRPPRSPRCVPSGGRGGPTGAAAISRSDRSPARPRPQRLAVVAGGRGGPVTCATARATWGAAGTQHRPAPLYSGPGTSLRRSREIDGEIDQSVATPSPFPLRLLCHPAGDIGGGCQLAAGGVGLRPMASLNRTTDISPDQ